MLKIKDNVDLKELEKYGYKFGRYLYLNVYTKSLRALKDIEESGYNLSEYLKKHNNDKGVIIHNDGGVFRKEIIVINPYSRMIFVQGRITKAFYLNYDSSYPNIQDLVEACLTEECD